MTSTGELVGREQTATTGRRVSVSPVVVAEAALALLTIAAILGFSRLYRDASFALPLIVLAIAGHLLAAACRRRRFAAPVVAAIAVLAGVVLIVWLFFGSTTVLGLPTPDTLHSADAALRSAWDRFGVVVAPAPVLVGFQLVAAMAVWAGIWFADWAAFRLWAAAESVAPAAVLFVFGSMLGAPRHRVVATLLFAAAALAFLLVHRMARQELTSTWITTAPGSGRRSLLRVGATLGGIALVGGALFGPHVPGANRKAVLAWRQASGQSDSRITVSPLVDIRKRLVDQSNEEAFNVRSNRPAYWRLTSLDTFDGRIWSSGGSFSQANGPLPQDHPGAQNPRQITQQYEIGALSAIWVPAAFEASSVDPGDTRMRWDSSSSTLIVDDDQNTSDGFNYTVVSELPQFTPAELRRSHTSIPAAIRRTYLELPGSFNREAVRLAQTITRAGKDSYDRALLLQNWFRDRFTYDLAVPPGHSEDAIAAFLTTRRGYCEQFAGTYAAMARAIGLPSRVAVGFTPGDVDPSDPELYRVKGKHAHAWPEVWFADAGWVPFEPTPGRGEPGATSYTGVQPEQASSTVRPGAATKTPESTPTSSTPVPSPKLNSRKFNVDVGNGPAKAGRTKRPAVDNPLLVVLIALLIAALVYVLAVLAVPVAKRRRARRRAVTPAQRVALAWDEANEAVASTGSSVPFSSETHHEYAARVAPVLGPSATVHRELASVASETAWSDVRPDIEAGARAEALTHTIRREITRQLTVRQRTQARLDPRRLVRRKRDRRTKPPEQQATASARS